MNWTARHFYRAVLLSFVSLQVIFIGIVIVVWTWFLVGEYGWQGVLGEGPLLFTQSAFAIFLFVLLPSALHAILFVAGFILVPRLRGLCPAVAYSVGLGIAIVAVHAPMIGAFSSRL